jgi:hypothetical protein
MSQISFMSFRAKSRNLSLFLFTLLLGCAATTVHRHQPSLARAEVLRIASRCAADHNVHFRNYFEPEIDFEGPNMNEYQWGLYFFRKPERNPNKGFLVCVDDRTKRASFYWFSQLPTE